METDGYSLPQPGWTSAFLPPLTPSFHTLIFFAPSSCCVLPLLLIYLFGAPFSMPRRLHVQKAASLFFGPALQRGLRHSGPRLGGDCWINTVLASFPLGLPTALAREPPPPACPHQLALTLTNSRLALWPDTHSLRLHCSCLSWGSESYSSCSCGLRKQALLHH